MQMPSSSTKRWEWWKMVDLIMRLLYIQNTKWNLLQKLKLLSEKNSKMLLNQHKPLRQLQLLCQLQHQVQFKDCRQIYLQAWLHQLTRLHSQPLINLPSQLLRQLSKLYLFQWALNNQSQQEPWHSERRQLYNLNQWRPQEESPSPESKIMVKLNS